MKKEGRSWNEREREGWVKKEGRRWNEREREGGGIKKEGKR